MVHIDKHAPVTETDIHLLITDASDLGLRPGEWPMHISTDQGNGQDFVRDRPIYNGRRDFGGYVYVQGNGCLVLHVLND